MKSILTFWVVAWAVLPLWADDPTLQSNAGTVMDTTPSATPLPAVPNDNTLPTFDEEFKGGSLDDSKWNKWYPWPVVINRELQNYVLDAFEFPPGGGLRIRCDERAFMGKKYSSGSMTTSDKFLQAYGYFEMKAKLPRGNGFWPGFWLMPPAESREGGAEIDIMENLGQDPHTVYLTLHSTDPVTKKAAGKEQLFKGPDFSDGYHVYAVSWRPKDLVWLVDGVERFHIAGTVVPSVPEYMLVNLAIGGIWPVPPDSTTPLPSYLDVEYIRAYQYRDLPPTVGGPYTLGKTTVTPETVPAGGRLGTRLSITAGSADLPPMLARLYVTDFYGKNYLHESDLQIPGVAAGTTAPLQGEYLLPDDLAPGIYTVAMKLECPVEPHWAVLSDASADSPFYPRTRTHCKIPPGASHVYFCNEF